MRALADLLLQNTPVGNLPAGWVYLAVALGVAAFMALGFVAPFAGTLSWVERRVAGRMHARIGPNRVGPEGFFQWIADALKLLQKEDLIPRDADRTLFKLAPYFVFMGMFLTFLVVPFSSALIVADLDIGILYLAAVTSLVTVGIIMAGWSSNNKWSLFGAIRSAAQIVSYEIPLGLSFAPVVLLAGTLSMQGIIRAQGGGAGLFHWYIFHNPFTFISFFVFFTASLAELNRVPFDIPEAESELVSGYNTEYSGMRFSFFFMAEWANVFVSSAVATTLFLGGWHVPVLEGIWDIGAWNPIWRNLFQLGAFMAKSSVLIFVILWVRWSLSRLRVDQLMSVCWKYLVPISFFNLFGVALWMLVFQDKGIFAAIFG